MKELGRLDLNTNGDDCDAHHGHFGPKFYDRYRPRHSPQYVGDRCPPSGNFS